MNKHWIVGSVCVLLAACGAPGEAFEEELSEETTSDEGAFLDEETELGTLEQHLDEASCGSANTPVNRAVVFSGRNVRFAITPPYGGAACTNAFLTGLSSTQPRNGTVSIIGQLRVPAANCPQARMRSHFLRNGAQVVQRLEDVGEFRNGRCLVSVTYNFNTQRTINSVTGTDKAFLAGGTPALAANARFAAQAVDHLGQIQPFTWEINP